MNSLYVLLPVLLVHSSVHAKTKYIENARFTVFEHDTNKTLSINNKHGDTIYTDLKFVPS